jgi:predicted aspartyl protease
VGAILCGAWILAPDSGTAEGEPITDTTAEMASATSPLDVPLSDDGSYAVDGTVDGSVGRFIIDTGASGSQIPQALAAKLALKQAGSATVVLADGSKRKMATYIAASICVADICAHDLEVTVAPEGLIGTDFIAATGAQVSIADGTLTMESPP